MLRFLIAVTDLIFPALCKVCGKKTQLDFKEGYPYLCEPCFKDIEFIEGDFCAKCGKPFESAGTVREVGEPLCYDCGHTKRYFEVARSAGKYEGVLKECIHKFKYGGVAGMKNIMGRMLFRTIEKELSDFDVVVPVPLHRKKLRERGFNQSELVARFLARRTGKMMLRNVFRKVNQTPSQMGLEREARLKNLKGSFAVAKKRGNNLDGRIVLLVDDVFTTGSTASECSKVLLENGARAVKVATIGR